MQIYGCPITNCPSQPLWGAATIGLARPDVVTAYGYPAGANAGYSFTMSGLAPDVYYVTVWTHTASTGAWLPFTTSFTVTSAPEHVLEHPTPGQSVAQPFTISGWAIDAGADLWRRVDVAAARGGAVKAVD